MIEDVLAKHLDLAIERTAKGVLAVELNDSHRFAYLKGQHVGLSAAREMLAKLMKTDITDEDI